MNMYVEDAGTETEERRYLQGWDESMTSLKKMKVERKDVVSSEMYVVESKLE
jgi:hypothetical protein